MPRLLVCLLLVVILSSAAGAAPPRTTREYAQVLSRVSADLARAERAGKAAPIRADRALRALPASATLHDPGAPPLTVDNRDLLPALREMVQQGPRGVASARAVLVHLQQGVAQTPPPVPADASRTLKQVLARSEFRQGWWEKTQLGLWDRLRARLQRLLDRLRRSHGWGLSFSGAVWKWAGWGVLLVCAGLMLYLIVRLLTRLSVPARPEDAAAPARPEVTLPYSAWLEEAQQCLHAGDPRGAVRALHMAALMKLDEAGLVRYDRAFTDGRFVRALQAQGRTEPARALGELNRVFARVWYGSAPAGASEVARAQLLWRELESGVSA